MDLSHTVRAVAGKLRAELVGSAGIGHSASKGRVREAMLLKDFLRRVLPETIGVTQGAQVVAGDGTVSEECDLVIYDRDFPAIYRSEAFSVLPIEAVRGVIEVKSKLDGAGIAGSANKIGTIKRMPITALRRAPGAVDRVHRYGRLWDETPVCGHVIAFDSISLPTLARRLRDAEAGWPQWECIDTVYVLTKGWLADATPGGPQRVIYESQSDEDVVIAMLVEFMHVYQRSGRASFDPGPYLPDITIGNVVGFFGGWTDDGRPA
jgi:hypothetical protein